MIHGFHVGTFAFDDRMELSEDEKVLLYCSADQWQRHHGPLSLICDEHFYRFILREGLVELYMDIVPLPECTPETIVETALRTAPIGYVYVGLDVVVDGTEKDFGWKDLFQAKGPDLPDLTGLAEYPKRTVKESVELLEALPGWIE